MPGMDDFICVPTETIKEKEKSWKTEPTKTDVDKWPWDKNLDDFQVIADNLRNEGHESRAIAVEYLIERCKRDEFWK